MTRFHRQRARLAGCFLFASSLLACSGDSDEDGGDSTAGAGGSSGAAGKAGSSQAGTGGAAGACAVTPAPCGKNEVCAVTASGVTCTCPPEFLVTSDGSCLARVDKVDILLGIDNSSGMQGKEIGLMESIGELIHSLTNPKCLDPKGAEAPNQPATGLAACPPNSKREHAPIHDIHIGIVSSSLGGHGGDVCSPGGSGSCSLGSNRSLDDHGLLLNRVDVCSDATVATYQNKGFLAWDATQKLSPPGESDITKIDARLHDMILGVGALGCGYEAQLESWYRFLVDPEPYKSLVKDEQAQLYPSGTDAAVLVQRKAFLRPDSFLAVVMLSDENDCSIQDSGTAYQVAQIRDPNNPKKQLTMPRARQECATNPADPCCKPCSEPAGSCPVDPQCQNSPLLSELDDGISLRCFDQKKRFGRDFLYPTDRYVQGLTSPTVPSRKGTPVPNPLFTDLDPTDGVSAVRDPGLVLLAGIVGVPWQDISRDPKSLASGYKDATELGAKVAGASRWDLIVGSPATFVPPLDPLMLASTEVRMGTNPVTGDPIVPPDQPLANPINGNDYSTTDSINNPNSPKNDLEYACISPLEFTRDCTDQAAVGCACGDPFNDSPLCEASSNGNRTTQTRDQAYPAIRQLSVLKGLGPQGLVTSICEGQRGNPSALDYAYRQSMRTIHDRMKGRLKLAP